MADKVEFSKRVGQKIEAFFKDFPVKKFNRGEELVAAGAEPGGVMYLKNGYVRQVSISQDGMELTLHLFRPGAFFPLLWAVANLPNRYQFEAVGSCEVAVAPKERVVDWIKGDPQLLFELNKKLLSGLAGLLIRIEGLALYNSHQRVVATLMLLVKHMGKKRSPGVAIRQKLTHKELAAWSGLTRETTSLEMEKLRQLGLVEYSRREIYIPNLADLKKCLPGG